jgi:hypothetical protein
MEYVKTIAFKNDYYDNAKKAKSIHVANINGVEIPDVLGGAGDRGPKVFIADGQKMIMIGTEPTELAAANKFQTFYQAVATFKFTQ